MLQGAAVSASDISQSMAQEAQRRYEAAVAEGGSPPATAPRFSTSDLESLTGRYDTVTCLDVMIHYPQVKPHTFVVTPSISCERSVVATSITSERSAGLGLKVHNHILDDPKYVDVTKTRPGSRV